MSIISWECFNADRPNPQLQNSITELSQNILVSKGVDKNSKTEIQKFAKKEISNYLSKLNHEPNQTLGIDIFKPHEFDGISTNDESLAELQNWFFSQSLDWRDGSRTVQVAIDKTFSSAGSKVIKGGRESVILDNLVVIKERSVAIEIETSNNYDNGYWSLRQALRSGVADYGVMVVPWTAEGSGRADEGNTLGRLDREFDKATDLRDGPIYRIAVIRRLDIYRLMLKS